MRRLAAFAFVVGALVLSLGACEAVDPAVNDRDVRVPSADADATTNGGEGEDSGFGPLPEEVVDASVRDVWGELTSFDPRELPNHCTTAEECTVVPAFKNCFLCCTFVGARVEALASYEEARKACGSLMVECARACGQRGSADCIDGRCTR